VSLLGNPVVISAQLPDAREAEIRVGLPRGGALLDSLLDAVTLEVRIGGTLAAIATTGLVADDVHAARRLATNVAEGLQRGTLAPSTSSLEPLAEQSRSTVSPVASVHATGLVV
jgi:hypothetical protein